MKIFSKISSVIIVAAAAAAFTSTTRADEAVVKPLRYQPPTGAQAGERVVPGQPSVTCVKCEDRYATTLTPDSKLKTKTVLVAKHGCSQCKTTIVRTGAQKATGKEARQHTCGALLAASDTCCGGMK